MNRHGYHNEHEEDPEEGNVEMPLPTYDEVVGASSGHTHIGFKADVAAPRSSCQIRSPAARSAEHTARMNRAHCTARSQRRRKFNLLNFVVGTIGIVVIPLLILFIVLQLKNCRACEHPLKITTEDHRRNEMYLQELKNCNADQFKLERRYSEVFSNLQSVNKERDELLLKQRTEDNELKDLRYQYNTALSDATNLQAEVDRLHVEIEKYKSLIDKASNDLKEQKNT